MMLSLIGAIAKDLLVAVRRDESFFELSSAKRAEVLSAALGKEYPQAVIAYASAVSAEGFMSDIRALLPALTQSHGVPGHLVSTETTSTHNSSYSFDIPKVSARATKQASQLQVSSVALSDEFYSDVRAFLTHVAQEQQEHLPNALVEAILDACVADIAHVIDRRTPPMSDTQYAHHMQRVMGTYQEIEFTRAIQAMLASKRQVPSVVVQTPLALEPQERAQMRADLLERVPGSFPLFEVEASLVGGVRVFVGGQLQDESLFTRVAALLRRIRT